MHINFSLILIIATAFTGFVWLLDKLFLKKMRKKRIPTVKPWAITEYSVAFFPVLFLVFILRSFVFEPFLIPSGSMLPTLKIGDFVWVNKFSYGLRVPITQKKFIATGEVKRGDVAVFLYPMEKNLNFIKRVVGLPGDKISYQNKRLMINGKLVEKQKLFVSPPEAPGNVLFREKFSKDAHEVYNNNFPLTDFGEFTVPENYYFMMGDNRDNSKDSRYWCEGKADADKGCFRLKNGKVMGFVHEDMLLGRAEAVWMHWPSFTSLPSFSSVRTIK